ncbi:ABC transporter substrate-binding protein [Paenibacillus rigui]|uniref:ABC transporter ATP-binding protein n=1 Tax=Paenibacillus rigui TaxID=554312 RepID=A0A229USV3_9BACL|nr:sugar ABC transporter substrate-binding protein [Paenibacillus rigui]OXM86482.1 ABC transporter ATP-binding protein [Paenibacillus rigui]
MNKRVASLTFISLALALSGCSTAAPKDTKQASTGSTNKKIELRMTWWGSQTRHDLTTKALKLFEEKHPEITIKPEFSGWDGYFDKLSTQVAGANAPDIIQMDYAFLADYAKRGALLDLGPYVQSKDLNTDKHDPSMIKAGSIDGKLYAITMGVNAAGVIYNASVFKELGIEEPKDNWTWKDFSAVAGKIAQAKGKGYFGSPDISGTTNIFEIYTRQNGHGLFTDGKLGASKEDLASWFGMWEGLRKSGSVTTPEVTAAMTNALETRPISLGTAAMDFAWSNQLSTFQKVIKNQNDKLKIQVIPHLENEKKGGQYLKPSQFVSGYSKTAHPKEVAMLIDFLVNDPEATKILGSERGVPVNSQVREQLKPTLTEMDQLIFDFINTAAKQASDIDPPYPQGFAEIDKNFKTSSEQISFGQGAVDSIVGQFITGSNAILSKTNK